MTLIDIRGGDGRLIGRCDARCHDATEPVCDCCCGGRNHGKGLERAVAQTRERAMDLIPDEWKTLGEPRIPILGLSEPELREKIARSRRGRFPRGSVSKRVDRDGTKFMRLLWAPEPVV